LIKPFSQSLSVFQSSGATWFYVLFKSITGQLT